jgi:hypothetical protein
VDRGVGPAVQEPAQHQHRLVARRQRRGLAAGTAPGTLGGRQIGRSARKSTVSSRTGNVAMDVTLIADAEIPMKLICGRATFMPGFRVFLLHSNGFGVVSATHNAGYGRHTS